MIERHPSPGLRLAIDYLPLVLFFAVNFLVPDGFAMRLVAAAGASLPAVDQLAALVIAKALVATAVFVVATIAAMVVSRLRLGNISPMLWITGALVIVFGGLTMWFHDPVFIQMKPTFVYVILAAVLGFGLVTKRPLLEQLLGAFYPGLDEVGWYKLTVNWTIFFVIMAIANEVIRYNVTLDAWFWFIVGKIVVTVLFAVANVPMLLKHGLSLEGESTTAVVEQELPPE